MATNGAQKKEEFSVSSAVWESFREEVTSEMDLVDEQKFSEYRNRKGPARQVDRKCKGRGTGGRLAGPTHRTPVVPQWVESWRGSKHTSPDLCVEDFH